MFSVISLASPSMRGATPLDVAAASVMDNNELALALREPDLEKVRKICSSFFISLNLFSVPDCIQYVTLLSLFSSLL